MSETRNVRIIQPKMKLDAINAEVRARKRVAAYARVSTDSDEQLNSYAAQVDYYTQHIQSNPQWEFVSIYTDEGITGTNTKKRSGFNCMVADALDDKIDLIITKSVSRFARNTVDTLVTIRSLKEKGVEVYFEEQNIYTLDSKGELLITIMASIAQEESRSISENVKWGKRKSMQDGKISLAYKHFLGYEKGENGGLKIVEFEAKIIRRIYTMFLEGKTIRTIANTLTDEKIPTPKGKKVWSVSTIVSILSNEKYKGDALLQKTYIADYLKKTVKKNEGEMPQYYIEESHPAIIDPKMWNLVQSEMKTRRPDRRKRSNGNPFAAKIICGECGGFYGSKVWHSADQYRTHIWQCNRKYKEKTFCDTPYLREDIIKEGFIEAFNRVLGNKEPYIQRFKELLPLLADTSALERQCGKLSDEMNETETLLRRRIEENAKSAQNQDEYEQRYDELADRLTLLNNMVAETESEILEQRARKEKICRFLDELRQAGNLINEFDDSLWRATVDSVNVSISKTLTFLFKDGTEISVVAPENK